MLGRDIIRQIAVTVSAVLCVYGTLLGTGVIGTRVEESSGGRLAADATLIAPATTAFTIWSVIYLGLFGYVIWQWLPAQRESERHRNVGYLAAVSMVLNAGWLLVTQVGWLEVSIVVMLTLLTTLAVLMRRLESLPRRGRAERVLVDGTFGLYLGWVSVATAANIAAVIVARGVDANGAVQRWVTVAVIAAVIAVAWLLASRLGGRAMIAAGIVWGLAWVAVGRLTDEPSSALVGISAGVAALTVALLTAFARRQTRRERSS